MVSIIIPTYNEASRIGKTLMMLQEGPHQADLPEIIVADGGSTDETLAIARNLADRVIVIEGRNRSAQLNAGAAIANGSTLLFLHADSVPPVGFLGDIVRFKRIGYKAGCFRLEFDLNHWFLRANAWFTRLNLNAVRFGDQGLYVEKSVFTTIGGYDEHLTIMEDQQIISRIRQLTRFKVIPRPILTSARKYEVNGVFKTQIIFYLIWLLYYLGVSQRNLISIHRKLSRKEPLTQAKIHGDHSSNI